MESPLAAALVSPGLCVAEGTESGAACWAAAAASAASLVLKRRPATLRLPVNGGVPDAGAAG